MAKRDNIMLTTVDNPWDPFTQFRKWYAYDMQMGYDTCGRIARLASASNGLSEEEYLDCRDAAFKQILDWYNVDGPVYRIAIEGKELPFGIYRD